MPVLVSRSRLTRILYDMKMLRRRLELLEVRLERSLESKKSKEAENSIIRSYSNAIRQIRFVVYSLEVLEVKLESILALNAMTQDLVVVREALKELSRRVRSLPEVSAILDDIGDSIGDVMAEIPVDVDQQVIAVRREAAKKILEEAERLVEADNSKASQIAS
ncbi:MAG: hypothetical protein QXT76_01695 [Sulfolobales archaeon]